MQSPKSNLQMLAALALHVGAMPASAEAVVTAPRLVTDHKEKLKLQNAQEAAQARVTDGMVICRSLLRL